MKTPIYHPNIYEGNGHICLNTLSKNWNSTMTLERLFLSIMMLLDLPNTDDFLDYDKAQHFIKDHDDFVKTAKKWVEKYAKE
jgi:ubiquitin-protein ligase